MTLQSEVLKKYIAPGETTWADVTQRMVNFAAKHEIGYSGLQENRIIPAGSILYGLDNPAYTGSFSNCYYIPILKDSIEGIWEAQMRTARTFSLRGGVGTDISILRPEGACVNNAAKTSTGAISFIPLFSQVAETIGQNGRRGALIVTIDCRHPDVKKFILAKYRPQEVFAINKFTGALPSISAANLSVKFTDDFMHAVEKDGYWDLVFPDFEVDKNTYNEEWDGNFDTWGGNWKVYETVKAREIFDLFAEAQWACGDPGAGFITTIQKMCPASYVDKRLIPVGFNPCGEQPLPNYGNCLLVALVLPKYVTEDKTFNYELFKKDVTTAVQFADAVSRVNKHPFKEQQDMDEYSRRIGVEVTGLADMLALMGLKYSSDEARNKVEDIFRVKAIQEIWASANIAKINGCVPALMFQEERKAFLDSPYIRRLELPKELKDSISASGLAHTAFNTVGPCGSISVMADNCTSGIEPLFAREYTRETAQGSYAVSHSLDAEVAHEIHYTDRIAMQAIIQKYIDASISSTINLPNSATVQDVKDIYRLAWDSGLKGVTVFRDGCRKGVLNTNDAATELAKQQQQYVLGNTSHAADADLLIERTLLDVEVAERHRVYYKGAKVYIITSLDEREMPVEIFAKLPRQVGVNGRKFFDQDLYNETVASWDAICRLASKLLRYNVPLEDVVAQLSKASNSMTDAPGVIARILNTYSYTTERCPQCNGDEYIHEGGCAICKECGYSNCG